MLEDSEVTLPDAVRQTVVTLDERGIIQSIASRNDHGLAWSRLEQFGIAEYFIWPQINWGRKSDSVRQVADQLSFAEDPIAFIDDQPTELAEVEEFLRSLERGHSVVTVMPTKFSICT